MSGDLSGAVSSACGAVDSVTAAIYANGELGDPGKTSFQERVKVSLRHLGTLSRLESELSDLGWLPADVKVFVGNLEGSLNQAALVMQFLRSKMGDVHGSKQVLRSLVYDSLKWSALLLSMLQ